MLGRARKGRNGKGSGHGRRGLYAAERAARSGGRPDADIVFKIKQYLRKVHRIPADRIKTEHAIKLYKSGGIVLGPSHHRKGMVRTPDIVVVDEEDKIRFVIEQDGRIHDSKKHAEKDEARNRHYTNAGIPCIVLNTSAIRSEGMTAAQYLDREMERVLGAAETADSATP